MISISKKTMNVLVKDYGLYFGENGISRTYTHDHHYYLCESYANLKTLKEYYKKIGIDPAEVDRLHSCRKR